MKIRNAQYNKLGGIDCEICHPRLGWIPYSADLDDNEPLGAMVFEEAKNKAKPYVPPPPPSEDEVRAEVEGWADTLVSGNMKDRAVGLLFAELLAKAEGTDADTALPKVRDMFRDNLLKIRGL